LNKTEDKEYSQVIENVKKEHGKYNTITAPQDIWDWLYWNGPIRSRMVVGHTGIRCMKWEHLIIFPEY